MGSKFVLALGLVFVLLAVLGVAIKINVERVEASGAIYIRANGLVEGTNKIANAGNITYTFTGNITDSIVVERSNIIVDGNGYTLQCQVYMYGFYCSDVNNVTIRNTKIKNCSFGVYLNSSSFNTISGNNITNSVGLYLHSSCNNNTVFGNTIKDSGGWGVVLESSSNNTFSGNDIINCGYSSVSLGLSSNNTFSGNNITKGSSIGLYLWSSSFNIISGNNITSNGEGMWLDSFSNNNKISGNTIANNTFDGISLSMSSNNVLRSNSIVNNQYNFGVYGYNISDYVNDVDTSNVVDGKPIYYWVNRHDLTVPLDVGYVALVNCTRMTVQNLDFAKNREGVMLAYTTNTTVTRNNITNNIIGVYLASSFNNQVTKNNITNNMDGLYIEPSSNNTISGNNITSNDNIGVEIIDSSNNSIVINNITNNGRGLYLDFSSNNTISGNDIIASNNGVILSDSSNNTVIGNTIANNMYGIDFYNSSSNTAYHNNFMNNTFQVYVELWDDSGVLFSTNIWDNGVEGNYWSNYTGLDSNHDGIGDITYTIDANNTDHYPLMGMFHCFDTPMGTQVNVISNSTIEDFQYFESNNTIVMHVSNMTSNQTFGFVRICIPHALMNDTYQVKIDGVEPYYVNYTLYDNGTHRWIYFSYQHSTLEVIIVPEFPSIAILPFFMIATLLAVIVYKRKHPV